MADSPSPQDIAQFQALLASKGLNNSAAPGPSAQDMAPTHLSPLQNAMADSPTTQNAVQQQSAAQAATAGMDQTDPKAQVVNAAQDGVQAMRGKPQGFGMDSTVNQGSLAKLKAGLGITN